MLNPESSLKLNLSIFPYKAKYIGFLLMALSVPFIYLYFWGGKPEIFNIKIFAIVTTYLQTKYFVVSQTNILDELAAIFLIGGIGLVSFSKEQNEKFNYNFLRIKALINSLFFTILLWLISFLLVYGMAIFIVSFSILIIFLLAYNVLFRLYLHQEKTKGNLL
ncbi:MAG: hypothetical protein PHP53_22970 [Prolixibacteraceae bacterium]|nr:hypothetical protein [Prolixibacteraceae bacterium]